MDEENVDWTAAEEAMERYSVTPKKLLHGINNHSGRIDDPYVDDSFVLTSVVDEGLPIDIHCVATKLEEKYKVLHVCRVRG